MARIDPARLWSLQYRLVASVIADIGGTLAALDLDPKALFILATIDEAPFPAEVAAVLCIPKPTMTVHLKRLEAAGLVRRQIEPTDLRRYRLQLTAAGRRLLVRGTAALVAAFDQRLARLSAAQQGELQALLTAMHGDGEGRGDEAPRAAAPAAPRATPRTTSPATS